MASVINVSLITALLLPGALVSATAWAWWDKLARPWVFVIVGTVGLYSVAIYLMTRQLSQIAIAGVPKSQAGLPQSLLQDPLTREALVSLLLFLAVSATGLWVMRYLLSLTRG